jgi:hypothetical protein
MEIHKIFGNKEIFGIEIKIIESTNTQGYLRIWLNGISLGKFKKKGLYTYGICNLKKYFYTSKNLYDNIFDNLNDDNALDFVNEWLALVDSDNPKDWDTFEKRKKYIRFLGDHLDNISIFSFNRNDNITFIVHINKKNNENIQLFKIPKINVDEVFSEYITWYENNYGEVKCDYNVFP